MSVPITTAHGLSLVLQIVQNLTGLQRDMRTNAAAWRAAAQSQSQPVETISAWMLSAASSYQTRLGWLPALQSKADVWQVVSAAWSAIGGTSSELTALTSPFESAASVLLSSDKSSHAAIVVVCDQILAEIDAPPTLWPE